MKFILSFWLLISTLISNIESSQDYSQFFEQEATLEAIYEGVDYIFHLIKDLDIYARIIPSADPELLYHVVSFEPKNSNFPQHRLSKTPWTVIFPTLKHSYDKNSKGIGWVNTGMYEKLETKKENENGEFYEKGLFKAKGYEVGIETKFYLGASPEYGVLTVKYEDIFYYKLHIERDSSTLTEPKYYVNSFEPDLNLLKRNPRKLPEIVYFPIEEMINNTYIFGDRFYEPQEKEKTCEFYVKAYYEKGENERVETKVYICGSEWGVLNLKCGGEDYKLRIKRDHSTLEEPKFRVDDYDDYLWTSRLHKIPEIVYFPKEEMINNTFTFGDKFYEPEKKKESCEFYGKGLYKKADNGVGVETKFYLVVKAKPPAVVESTGKKDQQKRLFQKFHEQ